MQKIMSWKTAAALSFALVANVATWDRVVAESPGQGVRDVVRGAFARYRRAEELEARFGGRIAQALVLKAACDAGRAREAAEAEPGQDDVGLLVLNCCPTAVAAYGALFATEALRGAPGLDPRETPAASMGGALVSLSRDLARRYADDVARRGIEAASAEAGRAAADLPKACDPLLEGLGWAEVGVR